MRRQEKRVVFILVSREAWVRITKRLRLRRACIGLLMCGVCCVVCGVGVWFVVVGASLLCLSLAFL